MIVSQEEYYDTKIIPPTTAHVERLFSMARYVISEQRTRLHADRFQGIMMLKLNYEYWNINDINEMLKKPKLPTIDIPNNPITATNSNDIDEHDDSNNDDNIIIDDENIIINIDNNDDNNNSI